MKATFTNFLGSVWLPVLLGLLTMGPTIFNEFVQDDVEDIVRHPVVGGGESLFNVLKYDFKGNALGSGPNTIRPLTTFEMGVEWRLWGDNPMLFHCSSVIFFLLLLVAMRRFFMHFFTRVQASVGVAIFAVLAIHVEAVSMVASRSETLSLLFSVLALSAALRSRVLLTALLYFLALLSKESAILLPVSLGIIYWVRGGSSALHPLKSGRALGAMLLVAIVFLGGRSLLLPFDVTGSIAPPDNVLLVKSWEVRLWMPFVLLGKYLVTTLLPLNLCADYGYASFPVEFNPLDPQGLLGVLFVAGSIVIFARSYSHRTKPAHQRLLISIGGFFVTYALFSNSVFLIVTIFAERLFFAPSMWLIMIALSLFSLRAKPTDTANPWLPAVLTFFLLFQFLFAQFHIRNWRSNESLMHSMIQTHPTCLNCRMGAAKFLSQKGEHMEAIWNLGVAIAGKGAFPNNFALPTNVDRAPLEKRLLFLHPLIAPEVSKTDFITRMEQITLKLLGPETARHVQQVGHISVQE